MKQYKWEIVKRGHDNILEKKTIGYDLEDLIFRNLLEIGEGTIIDEGVILCHPLANGNIAGRLKIGKNCKIRSGTVFYCDVEIGDNCTFGHNAVVRECCRIGNNTSIGTLVSVENNTIIGNNVSVETAAHITGHATIEDYVFIGGFVGSTNDLTMKYRREGHGKGLKGATIKYGARIGSGAILMPGIIIGEYSIINAGEVVRKDAPARHLMFTEKNEVIYKPLTNIEEIKK